MPARNARASDRRAAVRFFRVSWWWSLVWLSRAVLGVRPSSRGLETCQWDRPNAFKGLPSGQHVRPRPISVGSDRSRTAKLVRRIGTQSLPIHSAATLDAIESILTRNGAAYHWSGFLGPRTCSTDLVNKSTPSGGAFARFPPLPSTCGCGWILPGRGEVLHGAIFKEIRMGRDVPDQRIDAGRSRILQRHFLDMGPWF
jgi:hypothetical protein